MSPPIRFAPEASAELEEAARWYEARRSGLGLVFLEAVDRAVDAAARWPDANALVDGMPADVTVRRVTVGRFPYYVAYLVTADTVHILAIAHQRRRPRYWSGRAPGDPDE